MQQLFQAAGYDAENRDQMPIGMALAARIHFLGRVLRRGGDLLEAHDLGQEGASQNA